MRTTSESPYHILVADDQTDILDSLRQLFRDEGFDVDTVRSPQMVLESVALREYDVLLLDLNYARDTTSGREGIELLQAIRENDCQAPILVMTAWATISIAVEAMRRGSRDFIQKPWDDERLVTMVNTHAELYRSIRRGLRLEAENRLFRQQGRPNFIADAPSMWPVKEAISQVGPSDANVLITGEHGTGKEVVAKMLHSVSLRSDKQLITVNTGGLPEGTFESEMFGHVKGAFTDASAERIGRFEMADGGTLFLDEIANVPLRQQAKLLRVLETGEMERVGSSKTRQVNARIISATNADLSAEAAAGNFRSDLLFRLNTVEIHIPPLRDRREDVPQLSAFFLAKYRSRYKNGKEIRGFTEEAMERLMEYSWPGNVRELDHAIERAVLKCHGQEIQATDLAIQSAHRSRPPDFSEMSLEEVEAILIGKALARCDHNVSKAAAMLGISRGTCYRRMEKYGLYVPELPRKKQP